MESGSKSFSGTLINDSNVINPSILLKIGADEIATFNYMEISKFGRKYFITDITALTETTCVVSGHVDVLSTYAADIRKLEGVIARQENKWNLYLDDNLFKVDSRTIIQTLNFSKGGHFATNPSIVLVVTG
jgi:hypothetical protein